MIGPAFAHPGGTDGKGGHWDHSTGKYHYHHGYSAHDHEDGVCPYDFDDRTGESSGTSGGSYSSTAYAASYKTSDWFPEYTEAQAARREAEAELENIRSTYLRNFALSAVVGLCGGLSMLIVQVKRSQKRLEELERRLLLHEAEAVARTKAATEAEWVPQLRIAESENRALLKKLDDANHERLKEEAYRRANCVVFAEMARKAAMPEQSIVYAEQVVKNTSAIPPGEEVVYVPRDLRSDVYHREYMPCGVRNMVLASKKNVEAYGLKPCPRCDHAALPVSDYTVCAAPRNTQVYHRLNSSCSSYLAMEMPLSEALQRGLRPCAKCNPPSENPKVWF